MSHSLGSVYDERWIASSWFEAGFAPVAGRPVAVVRELLASGAMLRNAPPLVKRPTL